jgi:hypothetical protein
MALYVAFLLFSECSPILPDPLREDQAMNEFQGLMARRDCETGEAYTASPFSTLSRDYFARFSRDPETSPGEGEIAIEPQWRVVIASDANPLTARMAGHFRDFLRQCMELDLRLEELDPEGVGQGTGPRVVLLDTGGGSPHSPGTFTIAVTQDTVRVAGRDPAGLRDGVAKLVERLGLRQAPFLSIGEQHYTPRITMRAGRRPADGTYRDLVLTGHNAAIAGYHSLYALSTSDAIAELTERRQPETVEAARKEAGDADCYGLKTYLHLDTRQKFAGDDPVFERHPELRGALTWKEDGLYTLCTEQPLVQRYLRESVAGIFRSIPELDGVMVIIGGEGLYHCFMRPYGVEKGHTTCERCEALGAETVVANLCNLLADAARSANPSAEVVVWPYSATHVWSVDDTQEAFIRLLKPGAALLTEIEKDEILQKPGGVKKPLWDYSIDLIGPGERARRQIAACHEAGIPVYLKSEPELSFEASRLPHVPCMDRWLDRADALASCGADGAWVFPYFRPSYGTSAGEVGRLVWWRPVPSKETLLQRFAARIAGNKAGPHLRKAWECVSKAIESSPEIPPYFRGPHYLGPAHPMCADPGAELPTVFHGQFRFYKEISYAEALKPRPVFVTSPSRNAPAFGKLYRTMADLLGRAVEEMDAAGPLVPERCRLMFDAEDLPIRWFFHTARTQANFHESCQLRDRLMALVSQEDKGPEAVAEAGRLLARWREVLLDEQENATQGMRVVAADVRLDFYYSEQHLFAHAVDMIRAKLDLLDEEIDAFLPSLASAYDLDVVGNGGSHPGLVEDSQ